MALLTPLSFAEAQALLDHYGHELTSLEPLEAGSVNSNFLLEVQGGRGLFARIYEEQGSSGASFEIELNEALARAGLPVARPLRPASGQCHLTVSGKPFAVYERVNGEVLCQKRVTARAAAAVGDALAAVHTADLGPLPVPEGRFGMPQIDERLTLVLASERTELHPWARDLRVLCQRLAGERRTDLPGGLIHGDLFRDNVLVHSSAEGQERVAALLDFESACRGPYIYDLMVTVLAWCYGDELQLELVRAMVGAYHARRPLSLLERKELVREGSVACLRFAATRLTDFSLRTPPGQAPGRDFRRFLQRREALVAGTLDQALEGVF